MKIAIISDTHDNWVNFEKAGNWIKSENIQLVLHCGDICSQKMLDDVSNFFDKNIQFVKGNGDYRLDLPEKLELECGGKKIAFTHFPDIAKKTAQSGKFNLVFYGHTHRPWNEKVGECHMVNPGELAGHFYKPAFAVYDTETGKLELKILEQLAN